MEILLELLAELGLETGFVLMVDGGTRAKQRVSRSDRLISPGVSFMCYVTVGALLGALSTRPFPDLFIGQKVWAVVNLIVTPVVVGLIMGIIGRWRRKKQRATIRLESFLYGWGFAFGLALARLMAIWASMGWD